MEDLPPHQPLPKRPCKTFPPELQPLAMDSLLEALLRGSDHSSSHVSLALEQILHRQASDKEKQRFLQRSLALGSQLQDAANRLTREHDSFHNSVAWPLTQDLTIKVFSLLGMHSLCQAAASCTMFNKLAMEPACYGYVDLTARSLRINNRTVAKIIQRAGQHLRSLKLGFPPRHNKVQVSHPKVFPVKPDVVHAEPRVINIDKAPLSKLSYHERGMHILTKSCLEPLIANNGAAGAMLKTLHLFNIEEMDSKNICKVIAACPGLIDLEFVGLYINARSVLQSVTSCCNSLKRLCFQPPKLGAANGWRLCGPDRISTVSCHQMVQGCPNISSLSLRGFKLLDQKVKLLLKGLHHLKEVDFSGADLLTGSFLRDLIGSGEQQVESLILRDCVRLKEVEVERLLFSLSTGECKSLHHLDVSNKDGLAALDWFDRRLSLSAEAVSRVRKERPELELLAVFPDEKSSSDCESISMISSFGDSDDSGPLRPSLQSSDYISEDTLSSNSTSSSDSDEDDNNDDDDDDDDEEAQFMSPYDYSDGENAVLHVDSDSVSNRSDAGESEPVLA